MGNKPLVTVCCCTYGRPISGIIWCFENQSYANREMIILDDSGRWPDGVFGDRWRIVSVEHRFATLGEKRNHCASLASGEIISIWDDDDTYFPCHLEVQVANLVDLVSPSVMLLNHGGYIERTRVTGVAFHSGWAYRRDRFPGYGKLDNGEDAEMLSRFTGELSRYDGFTMVYDWSHGDKYHVSSGSGIPDKISGDLGPPRGIKPNVLRLVQRYIK